MKKSILLECDSFTIQKLKEWILSSGINQLYKVYIITFDGRHKAFKDSLDNLDNVVCISYNFFDNYKPASKVEHSTYTSFIKELLNDHITSRLIDRTSLLPRYGIGVQNAFSYFTFLSYNILGFLLDNNFEIVYFRNTPHLAKEWIIAKAAEHLKIDIYVTERYVFPWLYTINKGFKRSRENLLDDKTFHNPEDLEYHINKQVENIRGDYDNAIPSYEKNRFGKGILKFYNPFKNKRVSLKRPDNFINKTRLFFYYKSQREYVNLENTDYIIFYLHYQSERTTLPEGYDFADQFYAISLLSRMLPEGIKLLIKEHPSMFTRSSEVRARSLFNYKQIKKLSNIIFCPMDIDNFELIDNAIAISTITGNVALEAYVRKVPVILFGRSLLKVEGVHVYKDTDLLEKFVNEVCENKIRIENVATNLKDLCINNSISGLDLKRRDQIDYHDFKGFQENAHYTLLTEVLTRKFKELE